MSHNACDSCGENFQFGINDPKLSIALKDSKERLAKHEKQIRKLLEQLENLILLEFDGTYFVKDFYEDLYEFTTVAKVDQKDIAFSKILNGINNILDEYYSSVYSSSIGTMAPALLEVLEELGEIINECNIINQKVNKWIITLCSLILNEITDEQINEAINKANIYVSLR